MKLTNEYVYVLDYQCLVRTGVVND